MRKLHLRHNMFHLLLVIDGISHTFTESAQNFCNQNFDLRSISLVFCCGLLVRSCWAELKYGRILAVGGRGTELWLLKAQKDWLSSISGPTTYHLYLSYWVKSVPVKDLCVSRHVASRHTMSHALMRRVHHITRVPSYHNGNCCHLRLENHNTLLNSSMC